MFLYWRVSAPATIVTDKYSVFRVTWLYKTLLIELFIQVRCSAFATVSQSDIPAHLHAYMLPFPASKTDTCNNPFAAAVSFPPLVAI
jgi:hypothetical protein